MVVTERGKLCLGFLKTIFCCGASKELDQYPELARKMFLSKYFIHDSCYDDSLYVQLDWVVGTQILRVILGMSRKVFLDESNI